jgi:hypothetical protein
MNDDELLKILLIRFQINSTMQFNSCSNNMFYRCVKRHFKELEGYSEDKVMYHNMRQETYDVVISYDETIKLFRQYIVMMEILR